MQRQFNKTKKISFVFALSAIIFCGFAIQSANHAHANPFKKVAGKSWRSTSATAKLSGGVDKLKCGARYKVSGDNTNFNLKCSGPGYFVNIVANFVIKAGKIKRGSWTEYSFGKKGWLSGRASKSSAFVKFRGSDVGGSMSVSLKSSRRQYINISSKDGTKIRISLRR